MSIARRRGRAMCIRAFVVSWPPERKDAEKPTDKKTTDQ
jgi:hypothetical protein